MARASLRERALELIASGREELPLPAVESERYRLSDRRYRRGLARTLDVISADPGPRDWWSPVYADREAVRAAASEFARSRGCCASCRTCGHAASRWSRASIREGATSPLYRGPGAAAARGARPHPARAHPALEQPAPRGGVRPDA